MPVGSSSLLLLCPFPWSEKGLEITAIFCCFVWHKDSRALTGIPSFVIWIVDLFVQEWKRFHKTYLKQESSGNILISGLSCFMIYLHTTSSWPSAILSQKRRKKKKRYLIHYPALVPQSRFRPGRDLWALVVGIEGGTASSSVPAAVANTLRGRPPWPWQSPLKGTLIHFQQYSAIYSHADVRQHQGSN